MFFEKIDEIPKIAKQVNCAVFAVPKNIEVKIPRALILKPESKTMITIEQVHDLLDTLKTHQNTDRYIIIRPAELLGIEASNAILKNLEEPQEKVHFVLVTDEPSRLLPTILSRAEVFVYKGTISKITEIDADSSTKEIAKKLLVAKLTDLVRIADEICKKKDETRKNALLIISTAVEMAYKSYLITGKSIFLTKIPKLVSAYENISQNGHIKLHLVADLI